MIDTGAIRLALRNALLDRVSAPTLPADLRWENVEAGPPPDGVPWLRETFMPSEERALFNLEDQAVGLVQYSVFVPRGEGSKRADDIANAIKAAFNPRKTPAPGGFVSVYRAEVGRGLPEDAWYQVPVSLYWRVIAQ